MIIWLYQNLRMQVSTYSRNHLYTAVCIVISRCEELSKQKKVHQH